MAALEQQARSGGNSNFDNARCGLGHWFAIGTQAFDMEFDAFTDETLSFFEGCSCDPKAWQVGGVGTPTRRGFLEDDGVFLHLRPACFKMLLYVPLAISSEG